MARVISQTSMTVDGLIEVGEWFVAEGEHDAASRALFGGVAGMLMGRPTFEGLAGYWSPLEGPWADMINPMPKFVASRTRQGQLEWNGTLIDGDAVDGVRKLKDELDRDLILIGSGELARQLIANDLVDELWIWMHPALGGEGTRPFEGERARLALIESKSFDSGVTLLRYAPAASG